MLAVGFRRPASLASSSCACACESSETWVDPIGARKLVGIEGKDSLAMKMSLDFIVEEADNEPVAQKCGRSLIVVSMKLRDDQTREVLREGCRVRGVGVGRLVGHGHDDRDRLVERALVSSAGRARCNAVGRNHCLLATATA